MASFVDRVVLHVTAGNGGHGVASVHREKFKPLGGPDGGNGGRGGSVIVRVGSQMTTLLDYHHAPHRRAQNGAQGAGDMRHGANAPDLVLEVPNGTVVKSGEGEVLADLVGEGASYTVAAGGQGGLGNPARRPPVRHRRARSRGQGRAVCGARSCRRTHHAPRAPEFPGHATGRPVAGCGRAVLRRGPLPGRVRKTDRHALQAAAARDGHASSRHPRRAAAAARRRPGNPRR